MLRDRYRRGRMLNQLKPQESGLHCVPKHLENMVEGPTMTFGYVSNGSRSDDDRQGVDFRRVADTVPGCILVADADGNVLYANKRFVTALGRPLEELLGEGWLESVEPVFLEQARAKWHDCIRTRASLDVT